MKAKFVRVLDEATDVFYIVGKFETDDYPGLHWVGWGTKVSPSSIKDFSSPTLIVKCRANGDQCAISHFDCPEVDLPDRGEIQLDHTIVRFAKAVRNIDFKDIPDKIDLRKKQ